VERFETSGAGWIARSASSRGKVVPIGSHGHVDERSAVQVVAGWLSAQPVHQQPADDVDQDGGDRDAEGNGVGEAVA
jgi:hypothetical protein